MSWLNKYVAGKYRGVGFHLLRTPRTTGGRRGVFHHYPNRDGTEKEDMGLGPRKFTLRMLLLEPGYLDQRDAMIAALEAEGSGPLVHPLYGELDVVTEGEYSLEEDLDGTAVFTQTFVRLDAPRATAFAVDTRGAALAAKGLAVAEAVGDFVDKFDVSGAAAFVSDAATTVALNVTGSINAIARPFAAAGNLTASLKADIGRIDAALTNLINSPSLLAAEFVGLVQSLRNLAGNTQAAVPDADDATAVRAAFKAEFKAMRSLFTVGDDLPAVARTTPQRIQQANNQDALNVLVQRVAVAEAAAATAEHDFDSDADAAAARRAVVGKIDSLLEASEFDADGNELPIDDDVHETMRALRAAVHDDLTIRGAQAPRLVDFAPHVTTPALVLAYGLYGDGRRADELVTRNNVPHPLFVAGSVPLKVLIDA